MGGHCDKVHEPKKIEDNGSREKKIVFPNHENKKVR